MSRVLLLSVVVACATSGALAQDPGDVEIGGMATSPHPIGGGDEKLEKIGSFAPPETSAEENDSVVLPRHLRCDGCRAVTHVMAEQLKKMTEKPGSTYKTKKGKTRMKESVYLEAIETTCRGEQGKPDNGLGAYGIKAVNGRNRLSGPGLTASDLPGVIMGGSKWPRRLRNKCGELVGEHGEDEIYDAFARSKSLFSFMCSDDCHGDDFKEDL
jgi:hypothetical protein